MNDVVSGFGIFRLVALRNALRSHPGRLLVTEGWAANAELYWRAGRYARRVEAIPSVERHDLRQRPSRVRPAERGGRRLARPAQAARSPHSASPGGAVPGGRPSVRRSRSRDQPIRPVCWGCCKPTSPATAPAYPFVVGEKLSYSAKLGMLTLGSATLEVAAIDTVRGEESFRFRFQLKGRRSSTR